MPMMGMDLGRGGQRVVRLSLWTMRLTALAAVWLGVVAGTAAASPDFTWQPSAGQDFFFSDAQNWVGGVAPTSGSAIGTLSFPGVCRCWIGNDLSGLQVNRLVLGNYGFDGNGIDLGAGGLGVLGQGDDASTAAPLTLTADQTWSLDGSELDVRAGVSGAAALEVNLAHAAVLGLYGSTEAGPITITGADASATGAAAGSNGIVQLEDGHDLNASDGSPVTLSDAALDGYAQLGPLTLKGGLLHVIQPGPTQIAGALDLDAASALEIPIDGDMISTTLVPTYGQVAAAGSVSLNGARLILDQGSTDAPCPAVAVGDVDTIITTTGHLTGTFAGIPDGAIVPIQCTGSSEEPTVRINYTDQSVTATIISDAPGSFGTLSWLSLPTRSVVTNEPTPLSLTVGGFGAPDRSGPAGSAEFMTDPTDPIAGCADVRVTTTADDQSSATCQATFAAADAMLPTHWLVVMAQFTPDPGSLWQASPVAGPIDVLVNRADTTTALVTRGPNASGEYAYGATVTPAFSGPAAPSGAVKFLDDGAEVPGCEAVPVRRQGAAGLAVCVTTPSSDGQRQLTASYGGDASFTGSTSDASTVDVEPPVAITGVQMTGLAGDEPALRFEVQARRADQPIETLTVVPPRGLGFAHDARAVLRRVNVADARLTLGHGELRIALRHARASVHVAIGRAALVESGRVAKLAPRRRAKLLFRLRVDLASGAATPREVVVPVAIG